MQGKSRLVAQAKQIPKPAVEKKRDPKRDPKTKEQYEVNGLHTVTLKGRAMRLNVHKPLAL